MNIEKHVTNLELSKRLKELGVEQGNTSFYWGRANGETDLEGKPRYKLYYWDVERIKHEMISAFLSSEIGELLPKWIFAFNRQDKYFGIWCHHYPEIKDAMGNNECDARAKMLIYLIENKIVGV